MRSFSCWNCEKKGFLMYKINRFKPLHTSFIDKYIKNEVKNEILKYGKGSVLDIGCGDKPFYHSLKNQINHYIALDHLASKNSINAVDIFATADNLPFIDSSFDVVLLTQVLEHLEEPALALSEIKNVLKQNGILIISVPFLYPVHEAPRDFYRFTEFGIKYLANKAGFSIEVIKPVSGFWITFFSFLSIYILRKSKLLYFLFVPVLLPLKYISLIFDKIDKKSKFKWSWNYYTVLRKV